MSHSIIPRLPFALIPWQRDFLRALTDLTLEECGGDISRAVFIFPHNRPRRYLSLVLRHHPAVRRPLIMPTMHTVSSLFTAAAGRILSRPAWNAGLLDRVGLLLACVRAESRGHHLPTEARAFFPWGVRLASLFEECFNQRRKPLDFLYAEGQVSPFAAMLLERLGGIFNRYSAALKEKEWTSPGFEAGLVADHLQNGLPLPEGLLPDSETHRLYIAGFHLLSGTEDALFRHLWERGARVVLHGDAKLATAPDEAHWSCRALADWGTAWGGKLLLRELEGALESSHSPRIRYFSGFDLHSQLEVLRKELASGQDEKAWQETVEGAEPDDNPDTGPDSTDADHQADTLVALPDSGLLMPTLHHLPHVDINISMGYPLARSPVFRLVDTLARLQEGRKSGGYYWRDLVDLIRHPYLKMLHPTSVWNLDAVGGPAIADTPDAVDGQDPHALRRALHLLEKMLRGQGRKYADPRELLRDLCASDAASSVPIAPETTTLLNILFSVCLTAFENPERPKDLAVALEGLCAFLLAHGGHLWKRFPIDAECLYRLRQSLVPELGRSELADEPFAPDTLFALLRSLMEAERVPFEAVPLVGLQVMGMLETRLLSFRRLYIIEAGEDVLPGTPTGDPLLPEALRREIGLPPLQSREQAAAYTFFRLLAGAEEVVLLWQEGGDAPGLPGLMDQKKKKSRFIEELLWQEEKKLGRLLAAKGKDGPLTVLESRAAPLPVQRRGIPVSPSIRDLIADLLHKGVSASLLDSYLRCPLRFYHERLLRLVPADEIAEGDDPLTIGTTLHKALQLTYAPRLGTPLPGGEALAGLLGERLLAVFSSECADFKASLPADSAAMLEEAGKKRLADYLQSQPPATPLGLESGLKAVFFSNGKHWSLSGLADRIDLRSGASWDEAQGIEEHIVIIDYKTGRLPAFCTALWEDEGLWQRLDAWSPSGQTETPPDGNNTLLVELAGRLESVQLPFYLLLHDLAAAQNKLPHGRMDIAALAALDAAWVDLGQKGAEIALFPHYFSRAKRQQIIREHIPVLISFLLRHISGSAVLEPQPGRHCDWCFCAKLCTVSPALA